MKKLILTFVFLLAAAGNAFGQSTTVSGTVTDSGAQTWNNGTYQFQFVPNPQFPTGPYTWTGGTLNKVISGTLNGSGAYSQSVPSNSAISPQGSKWILQVTSQATSPSFSTSAITITGGTQTVNVTPPAISINLASSPLGSFTRAYADAEISTPPPLGGQYYNVTSAAVRFWNGSVWAAVGGGGGGGSCPNGAALNIQFTDGTNCDSTTAFSFDKTQNFLQMVPQAAPLDAFFLISPNNGTFNQVSLNAFQTAEGGMTALFGNFATAPNQAIGHFYSFDLTNQVLVPFAADVSSFGNNGGGAPFAVAGFWGVGQDGRTVDGESASGQTLIGVAGGTAMRKTTGNVAYQSAFIAMGPTSDTGFQSAPTETSANSYGVDVYDQRGTSTVETAGIRIQSQTAPVSGTKFSIKADTGSGVANFGDGILATSIVGKTATATGTPDGDFNFLGAGSGSIPTVAHVFINAAGCALAVTDVAATAGSDLCMFVGDDGSNELSFDGNVGTAGVSYTPGVSGIHAAKSLFAGSDGELVLTSSQIVPNVSGASALGTPSITFGTADINAATFGKIATQTNCSSSASPAVCAAASAGSVVVAAAATTVVVNTTAVTANSQILLTEDSSLGTKLSVTCNTQSTLVIGSPTVSARSAGTSFTITLPVAPTTNPACFSYQIIN